MEWPMVIHCANLCQKSVQAKRCQVSILFRTMKKGTFQCRKSSSNKSSASVNPEWSIVKQQLSHLYHHVQFYQVSQLERDFGQETLIRDENNHIEVSDSQILQICPEQNAHSAELPCIWWSRVQLLFECHQNYLLSLHPRISAGKPAVPTPGKSSQ